MPAIPQPTTPKPRHHRPITFLHTADWQLGKPFAGIADPGKRARVQQERFEAIRRIAAVARDRQASFVIVAGDLFDSPTPTHETISAALAAIGEIGLPVFAIPGNHDHGGPDSLWEQAYFKREQGRLAPRFRLLDSRTPTIATLPDHEGGALTAVLLPCPLLRRHEADDPTAWIRDLDFSRFGDTPRIVIAHGSTASFGSAAARHDDDEDGPAGRINAIALDRLPIDEIDHVSLGDWHGFTAAGPKAWYSGTPEIDRFPKAGQEPGHVACVTISRGLPPTVAAIRTGRFRWLAHNVALDATRGETHDETHEKTHGPAHLDNVLTQATQPASPGEPGFDGCLVSVTLTGTVTLSGRVELDHVIEAWRARLLRLDLTDRVRIAPSADEIQDLAARPDDPIITRVATELVRRLNAGGPEADLEIIRQALHMLHGLTHAGSHADQGSDVAGGPREPATAQLVSPSPISSGATNA